MAKNIRSRGWTFTVNNYADTDEDLLKNIESVYLIFGKEVGDSGTPHLQGYIYFKNPVRFSSLKKKLPKGTHIESALGSPDQNEKYCKKDGDYHEQGTKPMSQKEKGECQKVRFANAFAAAKEGLLDDIPADIRVRYYRTWSLIKKDYMPALPDAEDVTGVWIYGPAGVGKSRTARKEYPGAYLKLCNKWWDGYQDEDFVIIDDFDDNHKVLGHHLKIWSDRYAFLAETKGGTIKIRPKKVIVTSQYAPEDIWDDNRTLEAINRRFTRRELTYMECSQD